MLFAASGGKPRRYHLRRRSPQMLRRHWFPLSLASASGRWPSHLFRQQWRRCDRELQLRCSQSILTSFFWHPSLRPLPRASFVAADLSPHRDNRHRRAENDLSLVQTQSRISTRSSTEVCANASMSLIPCSPSASACWGVTPSMAESGTDSPEAISTPICSVISRFSSSSLRISIFQPTSLVASRTF